MGVLVVSNSGRVLEYPDGEIYCGRCGKDISESSFVPHIDVYEGGNAILRVKDVCYDCGKAFYNSEITIPEAVKWAKKSKKLEVIKVGIDTCADKKSLEQHHPYELFTYKNRDGSETLNCVCGVKISAFDDD